MTTEDFEGVELLASGVRIHGHGSAPEGQVYSERDLEAIASANRELADEILVPLKIGHSPEQRLLHASGSRREVANRRRDRVGKARRDRRSADRRRRRARWQLASLLLGWREGDGTVRERCLLGSYERVVRCCRTSAGRVGRVSSRTAFSTCPDLSIGGRDKWTSEANGSRPGYADETEATFTASNLDASETGRAREGKQ